MSKQEQKKLILSISDPSMRTVLSEILGKTYDILEEGVQSSFDLCILDTEPQNKQSNEMVITAPLRVGGLLDQIHQFFTQQNVQKLKQDIPLGGFVFSPASRVLTHEKSTENVSLTEKEVDMMMYLHQHAGEIISRQELLENVWQYSADINTRTLETHIYRLRQKIMQISTESLLDTEDEGYVLRF